MKILARTGAKGEPMATQSNLLHVHYIQIASYETLEKIKISLMKPDKGNRVVILVDSSFGR